MRVTSVGGDCMESKDRLNAVARATMAVKESERLRRVYEKLVKYYDDNDDTEKGKEARSCLQRGVRVLD